MTYVVERTFRTLDSRFSRLWSAHEAYLHALSARGTLIGGGPWDGEGGEILLIDAPDEISLHRALRPDPLVRESLVAQSRIRNWNVAYGRPGFTGGAAQSPPPAAAALTPHERRIAHLVLAGHTNKDIAGRLGVSCRAVEQHLTRTYRKLSIQRRAQLAPALGAALPAALAPARQQEQLTA
ncbi:helix-turn-helix transcriptional regulator [Streptomyces rectiverticillatus]|uniref:helix-turn-helix transcriptional regulator n=1 Tax=Streptomyces rectiverticillatus TaxID=173860 RepID=UPI0015C3BC47|nr:helix-turn-helix transcriptional regulator [Streptomyces rectiverticillatus]QLE70584.1 helix-turn-helix transcriptional regulator [Streptomyces rectiverticillatus]